MEYIVLTCSLLRSSVILVANSAVVAVSYQARSWRSTELKNSFLTLRTWRSAE